MNDNVSDKKVLVSFMVHHLIMLILGAIVVAAIGYGYMAMRPQKTDNVKTPKFEDRKGRAKPLPDFIVDKIKPDELEQLKP